MLSIQGLICKDLKRQDKLPEKWEDLIMEETIPRNPITDSCFLYLDAINNTGNGHNANYKSGNYVAWKNLCGAKQVLKSNYNPSYTDNQPIIYDDSILVGYTGNWNKFYRTFERDVPSLGKIYKNTMEVVLTVPANKGFGIYGYGAQQSIYFLGDRKFYFATHSYSGKTDVINKNEFSFTAIPSGTRIYLVTRFDNGHLTIDVPSYNLHFEKNSIPYNYYTPTSSYSANIGQGAAMTNLINENFFSPSYISSLRVHTRVLTNDEIYANYKYEKFRYNIPEIES